MQLGLWQSPLLDPGEHDRTDENLAACVVLAAAAGFSRALASRYLLLARLELLEACLGLCNLIVDLRHVTPRVVVPGAITVGHEAHGVCAGPL